MPKVSVLVPIYNVEKYLQQCLESLVNQSLTDIEIICINDGSTDNSLKIISEYAAKDSRIKVISKENTGYGHSMNLGLDSANGEYIGILEPDDFAETSMFETLYKKASEKNLDVIKSDWNNYWGKNGKTIKAGSIDKSKCDTILSIKEYTEMINRMPTIWAGIYRKEFLKKNCIRFTETPGASYQDTSFNFKVLLSAKSVMFIDDAFVYYRHDNPNSSVKSKAKAYAICTELDEVEKFIKTNGYTEYLEYFYSIMFKAYRHNLLRLDKSLAKEFIQKYSEKFKTVLENENIGELFYSRCKKKEVMTLINNTNKYYGLYRKKRLMSKITKFRQSLISIKINSSRTSIKLFRKEILRIG